MFQMETLKKGSLFWQKPEKETSHYLTAVSVLFPANTKTRWDRMFSLNVIMSFEMQWCRKHKGGGGDRDAQGLKTLLEVELCTNQLLNLVQVLSS